MLRLYDFWRSSAAYRVRIALNLKGLDYDSVPIHLVKDGGAQHTAAFRRINPQELVPALEVDGDVLTQSLAIIEYLDEIYPDPAILPRRPDDRARVRAMALSIAADIHPIQNLRVLDYLRQELKQAEGPVQQWARHWIELGLIALSDLIDRAPGRGRYCYGDSVTVADVMLVPQLANARRFGCDLGKIGKLVEVERALLQIPAFHKAAPENQPHAAS